MEHNEYDRERSAFRLRNPPPEFAHVTARCRAAWLQMRKDAAAGRLPPPRRVPDPHAPTPLAPGPWYLENQAWLKRIAQTRIVPIHSTKGAA